MELSWIQRHALMVLLRTDVARVKELMPDVPANLFSYHLSGLISAGLVEKVSRGTYQLTLKGTRTAGSISTQTNAAVKDVKTVIMLYGKRNNQHLLFRWSRQPYLGQVTLPHDRVAFGSSLDDAIAEALHDKLGVHVSATYRKTLLVNIHHEGQVVSSMSALVYEVDVDKVPLPFTARNGEAFLADCATVAVMEGLHTLIAAIEDDAPVASVSLSY